MLAVIEHTVDTIFFLSAKQRISAQSIVSAAHSSAAAVQNFISSTAMATAAQR